MLYLECTSKLSFASIHNEAMSVLSEKSSDVNCDTSKLVGICENDMPLHRSHRNSFGMHLKSPFTIHPSGNSRKCKFGMFIKSSASNFRFRLPTKFNALVFFVPYNTQDPK